jgi:hypothetical protein
MFLKVKKLQEIQNLILETDLIQIGDGLGEIISHVENGGSSDETGDYEKLDQIFDWLLSLDKDDLTQKLKDPIFTRVFINPKIKIAITNYFKYLTERFKSYEAQLREEFKKKPSNSARINAIQDKIIMIAARLEVLDQIYETLKSTSNEPITDEILREIKRVKDELIRSRALPVKMASENVKSAFEDFQKADTQENKEAAAEDLFSEIQNSSEITSNYGDDFKEAIDSVDTFYTAQVERELGKERTQDIRSGIMISPNVAALMKRIFEFQYTPWTNEKDVRNEADSIRTSINTYPEISAEGKAYLYKLVDKIQEELIARIKSSQFDTAKFKGIHYDFKKKLPLYQRTALPVTGKQIADDSRIMKFRKAAQEVLSLLIGAGSAPTTPEEQAFARTGEHLNKLYSKTLNSTAMAIGKLIGGREGEMKADAISRMFIMDTSIVDKPKSTLVSEDMGGSSASVSPGASMQSPGSIGSMGPITPPTATTLGSGDKFSSIGSFGKKKKKSAVLGFMDFVREQKIK